MDHNNNYFDCAIITMLMEEMKLFLKTFESNIQVIEKHQNYVTFYFCDKMNMVRKGIIYNFGIKMGNTEACRLMYEFTRKYKADIFINVGLACGVHDVNIGDVVIVSQCYSLSENNSTTSGIQITPLDGYDVGYVDSIFNSISDEFLNSYIDYSKIGIEKIDKEIDRCNEKEQRILQKLFQHKANNIIPGKCATVPSVVKDEGTHQEIQEIRKCSVLEMEAYYFALWHHIIQKNENDRIQSNSKFLILKSPSDNGVGEEKELLERIGSRMLAMSNLSYVTKYLMEEIIEFNNNSAQTIPQFINEIYNIKSIDNLTKKYSDSKAFNDLCVYLIDEYNDDYFAYAKEILNQDGAVLTIYGPAGTGKSTFFSYLYNELKKEHYCIYIDIAKIIKRDDSKSIDICLYLIERMMHSNQNENITILFDGFGKDIEAPSKFIIDTFTKISRIVSLKNKQRISFCVNDLYSSKIESKYLPKMFSVYSINFTNIAISNENFDDFVRCFYNYYKNISNNLSIDYVENTISILKNSEVQFVDFRLLKMIADNYTLFVNTKTFHDFIASFCNQKGSANDLLSISKIIYENYYNRSQNNSFEITINQNQYPESYINLYKTFTQNIYTNAYLLSMNIWEMCGHSESQIDQYDFLVSRNINSFLAYCIKASNDAEVNKKVQLVLAKAIRGDINKSAAMQLVYVFSQQSIFRMFSRNTKTIHRRYVEDIAKTVFDNQRELTYTDIMEIRTMCIIMDSCYGEEQYLQEFNNLMINEPSKYEINDYFNYNIVFHFLYYSRETALFSEIKDATLNPTNENVVFYTYKAISLFLKNALNNTTTELHVMNFITLLYIYKNNMYVNNNLARYKSECKTLLRLLLQKYTEDNHMRENLKLYFNSCIYSEDDEE